MQYPIGLIQGIETLSMNHGPGCRFVVFISDENNLEISSIDLVTKILKFKHYFSPEGGVTLDCQTLEQKDFIISCLKFLRNCGIHTCIKTNKFDKEIMSLVDKVL